MLQVFVRFHVLRRFNFPSSSSSFSLALAIQEQHSLLFAHAHNCCPAMKRAQDCGDEDYWSGEEMDEDGEHQWLLNVDGAGEKNPPNRRHLRQRPFQPRFTTFSTSQE